jgi:hypothetical protein
MDNLMDDNYVVVLEFSLHIYNIKRIMKIETNEILNIILS